DLTILGTRVPHSPVSLSRFFNKLQHPEWITGLRKKGYFNPPQAEQGVEYAWFPLWPASDYLVRMSPKAPDVVAEIYQSMDTNHPRVFIDMMRAATSMAPDLAANMLVNSHVLEKLTQLKFPENEVSGGIVHLIKGKQIDAALQIMKKVFALRKGEEYGLRQTESVLGTEVWHYQKALKSSTDALQTEYCDAAISFLLELLEYVCDLQGRKSPDDASSFWLPAMETNAQNLYSTGFEVVILHTLLNTYESELNRSPDRLAEFIGVLETKEFNVFERILLHLLVEHGESELGLVTKHLLSEENLNNRDLVHEYSRLLRRYFPQLTQDNQARVISYIESGSWNEKDSQDEYSEKRKKSWQRDKLSIIRDTLRAEQAELLRRLEAELGETDESAEFAHYFKSWVGPESPLTIEQLRAMPFDELHEYLIKWKGAAPSEWAPSEEGLGRELQKLFAERPEFYSKEAMRFAQLDPTYVRAFFAGIKDGRKKNPKIDWQCLLQLCEWVIRQPRGESRANDDLLERNPHWGWTRQAIGEVLVDGLLEKSNPLIPVHRTRVWEIATKLIEDPDPSAARETASTDLLTLSINSVRGYAFEAIMRYMERVIITEESLVQEHSPELRLSYIPEVDKFLKYFSANDQSLMNRYQLGFWFPSLLNVNMKWATKIRESLFAEVSDNVALREAAWEGYSTHYLPNQELARLLRPNYLWAVDHYSPPTDETQYLRTDPYANLGNHLAYMYLIGSMKLNDELLRDFYAKSTDAVNGHVWENTAKQASGKDGESHYNRVKEFWQFRFDETRKDAQIHYKEIRAFGWMSRIEPLDPIWFLSHLQLVLDLTPDIELEHFVAKKLAELSSEYPRETLLCIEKMIFRSQFAVWNIDDEAHVVFANALASGDAEVAQHAKEAINRLIARGDEKFRDLL
ncbi:hypothetical protein KJ815_08190, partial [bacterium]|nr:hypothetical protein [bacterium]